MYGVQLIGSGAFDQVDSPGNNLYDLKFNKFFKNCIFDGNVVMLNYLKGEKGRFKDDLDEVLIKTMETGTIPEYVKDKVASEDYDFHLTVTKKERNRLAKICSKRYCDKLPKLNGHRSCVYGYALWCRYGGQMYQQHQHPQRRRG
jgi:hypothetical protein